MVLKYQRGLRPHTPNGGQNTEEFSSGVDGFHLIPVAIRRHLVPGDENITPGLFRSVIGQEVTAADKQGWAVLLSAALSGGVITISSSSVSLALLSFLGNHVHYHSQIPSSSL